MVKEGEGPFVLSGVQVDQTVPGLKEELEVAENVLRGHGFRSDLRLKKKKRTTKTRHRAFQR
jgi:hypothetical protein